MKKLTVIVGFVVVVVLLVLFFNTDVFARDHGGHGGHGNYGHGYRHQGYFPPTCGDARPYYPGNCGNGCGSSCGGYGGGYGGYYDGGRYSSAEVMGVTTMALGAMNILNNMINPPVIVQQQQQQQREEVETRFSTNERRVYKDGKLVGTETEENIQSQKIDRNHYYHR